MVLSVVSGVRVSTKEHSVSLHYDCVGSLLTRLTRPRTLFLRKECLERFRIGLCKPKFAFHGIQFHHLSPFRVAPDDRYLGTLDVIEHGELFGRQQHGVPIGGFDLTPFLMFATSRWKWRKGLPITGHKW